MGLFIVYLIEVGIFYPEEVGEHVAQVLCEEVGGLGVELMKKRDCDALDEWVRNDAIFQREVQRVYEKFCGMLGTDEVDRVLSCSFQVEIVRIRYADGKFSCYSIGDSRVKVYLLGIDDRELYFLYPGVGEYGEIRLNELIDVPSIGTQEGKYLKGLFNGLVYYVKKHPVPVSLLVLSVLIILRKWHFLTFNKS